MNSEQSEIRDRLKDVRRFLKLSQTEFASRLSLEKSSISLIERKQRNLTERTIKDICREFNVDYIWLTTGEGDMFHESEEDEVEEIVERVMSGENEFYKNLFKTFAKLGEEELLALEKIIDTFNQVSSEQKKG